MQATKLISKTNRETNNRSEQEIGSVSDMCRNSVGTAPECVGNVSGMCRNNVRRVGGDVGACRNNAGILSGTVPENVGPSVGRVGNMPEQRVTEE